MTAELISLEEVLRRLPEDHVLVPGFAVQVAGSLVPGPGDVDGDEATAGVVTAVLERTAVVELAPETRRLARHDQVRVDPALIESRPAVGAPTFTGRPRQWTAAADERGASDRRARREQAAARCRPILPSTVARVAAASPEPAQDTTPTPPPPLDTSCADVAEEEEPRTCARCGDPLARHNQSGVCTRCQGTCPRCDGAKAIQAELCRACAGKAATGPARAALAAAAELGKLPARVQELLDQVVTLARYAQALEDELAYHRTIERRLQRLHLRAVAAGAGNARLDEVG